MRKKGRLKMIETREKRGDRVERGRGMKRGRDEDRVYSAYSTASLSFLFFKTVLRKGGGGGC